MTDKVEPILQVAAKAILVNPQGKILIMREADESYEEGTNAGKYHAAAGGRINPRESFLDGLRREVEEETGITDFEPEYPIFVGEWWPVVKEMPRHIVGIYMVCKIKTTDVRLSEEHDKFVWISPDEIGQYDVLPAEVDAIKAYALRTTV